MCVFSVRKVGLQREGLWVWFCGSFCLECCDLAPPPSQSPQLALWSDSTTPTTGDVIPSPVPGKCMCVCVSLDRSIGRLVPRETTWSTTIGENRWKPNGFKDSSFFLLVLRPTHLVINSSIHFSSSGKLSQVSFCDIDICDTYLDFLSGKLLISMKRKVRQNKILKLQKLCKHITCHIVKKSYSIMQLHDGILLFKCLRDYKYKQCLYTLLCNSLVCQFYL